MFLEVILFIGCLIGSFCVIGIGINAGWSTRKSNDIKTLERLSSLLDDQPRNMMAIEAFIIYDILDIKMKEKEARGIRWFIDFTILTTIILVAVVISSDIIIGFNYGNEIILPIIIAVIISFFMISRDNARRKAEEIRREYKVKGKIYKLSDYEFEKFCKKANKVNGISVEERQWVAYLIESNESYFDKDFDPYEKRNRELIWEMAEYYYIKQQYPWLPYTKKI